MKLEKLLSLCSPKIYDHDLLITAHNHDFMDDPKFKKAYQKGVEADKEYYWYWRVHVGIWAASTALQVEGDFVECGVNKGFLSTSIMTYLDWNTLNRNFFLFDTFNGLNETLLSDEEKLSGRMEYS